MFNTRLVSSFVRGFAVPKVQTRGYASSFNLAAEFRSGEPWQQYRPPIDLPGTAGFYASYLYTCAGLLNSREVVEKDIHVLKEVFGGENRQLQNFLRNPLFNSEAATKLFENVPELQVSQATQRFFVRLAEERNLRYLPKICDHYLQITKTVRGEQDVVITTAKSLNEEEKNAILREVKESRGKADQKLNVVWQQDPTLYGGYFVRIGNEVLDKSFKKEREEVAKAFDAAFREKVEERKAALAKQFRAN